MASWQLCNRWNNSIDPPIFLQWSIINIFVLSWWLLTVCLLGPSNSGLMWYVWAKTISTKTSSDNNSSRTYETKFGCNRLFDQRNSKKKLNLVLCSFIQISFQMDRVLILLQLFCISNIHSIPSNNKNDISLESTGEPPGESSD